MVIVRKCATPNGVFRSNKIIIRNLRKVTDEMALDFYKKSTISEEAYPKVLGAVALMNFYETANAIFNDKVNHNTIDYFLSEWNDFMNGDEKNCNETVQKIDMRLRKFSK